MAQEETNYLVDVGMPIATFVLGFITSRFSLTKKERLDEKQRLFQNERELSDRHKKAYDEFHKSLESYIRSPSPGIDDFVKISITGDNYFRALREISEAMLSGNTGEASARDNFHPILEKAIDKTLPDYYSTLQQIAEKKGFTYNGRLERRDHEQLYAAHEKFA